MAVAGADSPLNHADTGIRCAALLPIGRKYRRYGNTVTFSNASKVLLMRFSARVCRLKQLNFCCLVRQSDAFLKSVSPFIRELQVNQLK